MILAYLEEDDTRRVLFRVRPLLTAMGSLSPEDLEEYEQDGCLRIAPDRQEQHSFKERMRSLGSLCLIDLTGVETTLGKVRPNKNYAPGRGENNRYIIYSDAVHALPADLVFEVVSEEKSELALTRQYYLRSGGRISGPHCLSGTLSCPASQTLMPDCERLFLVEMPDKTNRMFYWPQVKSETLSVPTQHGEIPQQDAEEAPAILPDVPKESPDAEAELQAEPELQASVDLTQEAGPAPQASRFYLSARLLHQALRDAGFLLEESQAAQLLLLCLLSSRLLIIGDCAADARLAAQTIVSLFPQGTADIGSKAKESQAILRLDCSGTQTLPENRLKHYQACPWPILTLSSGMGYPAPQSIKEGIDFKALLAEIKDSKKALSDEAASWLSHLLISLCEQGSPLPLMLRGRIAEYLRCSEMLPGMDLAGIKEFIFAVYALPYYRSKGLSQDEAGEILSR